MFPLTNCLAQYKTRVLNVLPYVAAKITIFGLLSVLNATPSSISQPSKETNLVVITEKIGVKAIQQPTPAKPVPVRRVQPIIKPKPIPKPIVKPTNPTDIKGIIIAAANKYGLSSQRMLAIAKCESTYNPNVVNPNHVYVHGVDYGTPKGLYQFLDSTWVRMSAQAGYAGYSVFNAYANANVTAWAWSHGHSGEWECQ